MKSEKAAIILLENWDLNFQKGFVLSIPKHRLNYGNQPSRFASFSHVVYEGILDEHFKVLDFVIDPDNISDQELEFTRMMYPHLEVKYERTI